MRLKFAKVRLLALLSLLAVASPMLLRAFQHETGKQDNPPPGSMQEIVRQNLIKDLEDDDNGARQLFLLGDEAVFPLIRFLSDTDREKRAGAARGLAYIGNPQGMQALRNAVRTEQDKETRSVMSYLLAGGLVGTTSQSDLNFLRSSIEAARFADDGDESEFTGLSAALALGMMGRSDSLAILRKVANECADGCEEIKKAIRWIENKPVSDERITRPVLSDEELIKKIVLDRTFFAEDERDHTSVTEITFNRERNKVLVSLEIYFGPKSARGYDLVLAKKGGEWRVVGIWFAWVA
jgi:HEAT repeat protein